MILLGRFNSFSYLCSEFTTYCDYGHERNRLGVNQQTLADLAGVGLNTLVAIERGEGNPQLNTLLTILDTLGLQMDINLKTLDYETV